MPPLSWLLMAATGAACVSASCDKTMLKDLTFMLSGAHLHWPCQSTKSIYESSGRYVSKNVIATRVQIHKDVAFVLTPRYRSGVPFTLSKMSLKGKSCWATLQPYPCWDLQEECKCHALQSAVDLFIDAYDILWVLDAGIVNTLEQPIRRCPPKVVGINVKTGRVVKVVNLSSLVCAASRVQYLVVDYDKGGNIYLYVSDAATRAIIVYDVTNDKGYRVMLPHLVEAGCTRRNVLYLVLVRRHCGQTVLYFTYLYGHHMFSIKTTHLRRGYTPSTVVHVGHKPSNMVLLGTDNGAAIFFRNKGMSDIYMWNTQTSFKSDHFMLVQKGEECRLATHVVPGYKKLMWVLESNFQDYIENMVGCVGASVALHPLVKIK